MEQFDSYMRGERKIDCMEEKRRRDLIDFVREDDEEFYEHYLVNLTEEECERFLKENPEFQNEQIKKNKRDKN